MSAAIRGEARRCSGAPTRSAQARAIEALYAAADAGQAVAVG